MLTYMNLDCKVYWQEQTAEKETKSWNWHCYDMVLLNNFQINCASKHKISLNKLLSLQTRIEQFTEQKKV